MAQVAQCQCVWDRACREQRLRRPKRSRPLVVNRNTRLRARSSHLSFECFMRSISLTACARTCLRKLNKQEWAGRTTRTSSMPGAQTALSRSL